MSYCNSNLSAYLTVSLAKAKLDGGLLHNCDFDILEV